MTWTRPVDDPPSRWYSDASLYADNPIHVHHQTGVTTLARIADRLYHDAIIIVAG